MKADSLRQLKKEATRKRLIDVSLRQFQEKGFDNTTIDEIVHHADVSQRTFFRHFPTKEAIVFSEVRGRQARFRQLLEADSETVEPFDRVKHALVKTAAEYDRMSDQLLVEYRMVTSSKYLTTRDIEFDAVLEKTLVNTLLTYRGSRYLSRKEARIAAAAIFGAVRVLMDEWFQKECRHSLKSHARLCLSIVDMLAQGFNARGAGPQNR